MNQVKESMNNMFNMIHHERIIHQFTKTKYLERFKELSPKESDDGEFHIYDGYQVVSPTSVIVKYKYSSLVGRELEGQFVVDID